LLRAEGRKTTPDETDYLAVRDEVIATQEGLTQAGMAIKRLQGQMEDLIANAPDADTWATLTEEIASAQEHLASAGETTGEAVKAFCAEMVQNQQKLSAAGEATSGAVKTLCAEMLATQKGIAAITEAMQAYGVERQELLEGFNSTSDARYWYEQARRFRFASARILDAPVNEMHFPDEEKITAGWTQEELAGYQTGRDMGYRAGYMAGYSEAAKGMPCRAVLPSPL
jgi:chromosome segregation ATPase